MNKPTEMNGDPDLKLYYTSSICDMVEVLGIVFI